MDPAGELAQLVEARPELGARGVEQRGELRVARRAPAGEAELRPERDHPRLRAVVQVALEPPALVVPRAHEPRPRGPQLLDPRAQLGGEALVLERQRRRRPGRADELRLLGELRVVADRGDPPALQLDLGPGAVGELDRPAGAVHEPPRLRQPVGDRHRRIVERDGQRVADAVARAEPRHELGDPVTGHQPRPQQPGQEGERDRGQQQDRDRLERVDLVADGVEPRGEREHEERDRGRPQHGGEHAPQRRGRAPEAPRHQIARLVPMIAMAAANWSRSSRSDSVWSAWTTSRFRGSPETSSNSSDGSCSTVVEK